MYIRRRCYPTSIEVLKGKLTYQEYFTFNNSALYVPKTKSNDNTKRDFLM